MIKNGDKIQYIGDATISPKNFDQFGIGNKGTVITELYQLGELKDIWFVDVQWKHEKDSIFGEFKNEQRGHPVNIKNLKVLENV
jgi:hypothetical protein